MTRFAFLVLTFLGVFLCGCQPQMKLPSFSALQLYDPKLILENPPPRDRLRSELVIKFPKREELTPDDERRLRELCKEANDLGATLTRSLETGAMTPEEYVKNTVRLELHAAYIYLIWTGHTENPNPPPPQFVKDMIDWAESTTASPSATGIQRAKNLREAQTLLEQFRREVSIRR